MKIQTMLIALALGVSTCLLQAQPDQGPGAQGGQRPGRRQGGGPGGPGGPQQGFHILPPFAQDQLNLTDDQKKQIADLEKQTKEKLDNILTEQQKQKLKDMHQNMRRRFGGSGGQGGPGGPDGERPPGGKQRPPSDQ